MLLEQIATIKQNKPSFFFSKEEITDCYLLLKQEHLLDPEEEKNYNCSITASLITSPEELMEIAKNVHSCLFREDYPLEKQLAAYMLFLEDPAALYFRINEKIGYTRLYAGEKEEEEILFEDYEKHKVITTLLLDALGFSEIGYVSIHPSKAHQFNIKPPLIKKLGSDKFKRGYNAEFYRGIDSSESPLFRNVYDLLYN